MDGSIVYVRQYSTLFINDLYSNEVIGNKQCLNTIRGQLVDFRLKRMYAQPKIT